MRNTSIWGRVATLRVCRDRLVGCSFWTFRFAACSSVQVAPVRTGGRWAVRRIGVTDPGANIVANHVKIDNSNEAESFGEAIKFCRDRRHVILG
jgi:hypothetical protein